MKFANTCKLSNRDINNLLCFWKRVFTHMDTWMIGQKLMQHHSLRKNIFSYLNIEDISDADYMHAKRACKGFKIKI